MDSVIAQPQVNGITPGALNAGVDNYSPFIISLATAADSIFPWGSYPRQRDQQLRQFWPTEHYLAGSISTTTQRYAALDWALDGPPQVVRHYQEVLEGCQFGKGWGEMMSMVCLDLFTQDNGAFIEIVRASDDPLSPVVSLNHLDAGQCVRTGRRDTPVMYTDINGDQHLLKYYQVAPLTELPAPLDRMRGMQYCAVTRILRLAQIFRDIAVYNHERVSGQFAREVHLVSGVQTKAINDAIAQTKAHATGQGLVRFIQPVILGALDPNSTVGHVAVPLASLPDNFDVEKEMKWYITAMALAFGTDYQDFAPLPGRAIGSGNEAKVSSMRSRGKGPKRFATIIQQMMNWQGILPKSVRFTLGEVDVAAEMETTALRKERALEREILIRSGQITTEVARQMAVDSGDLDPRYLIYMGEQNVTDNDVVESTDRPLAADAKPTGKGEPAPKQPPAPTGAVSTAQPNNNVENAKPPSQSQKVTPQ